MSNPRGTITIATKYGGDVRSGSLDGPEYGTLVSQEDRIGAFSIASQTLDRLGAEVADRVNNIRVFLEVGAKTHAKFAVYLQDRHGNNGEVPIPPKDFMLVYGSHGQVDAGFVLLAVAQLASHIKAYLVDKREEEIRHVDQLEELIASIPAEEALPAASSE